VNPGVFILPIDEGACSCGIAFPWNPVARLMHGAYRYRCDCGRRWVVDYRNGYGIQLEVSPTAWQGVKQLPEGVAMADILALLKTLEEA